MSNSELLKPVQGEDVKKVIPHALAFQILNVVGFVAVVIVNALSSAGYIGEVTNGEVSDRYPVYVTPNGYAFSVWGLIYFFCAAFTIYQALPSQRSNTLIFERIHILFFLSSVFNFIWSIIFPFDKIWPSAIIISLILVTLLVAYYRIGIGRSYDFTLTEFFLIHVTFSLYSAWLSVATVVNFSVALKGKSGWDGSPWTEDGWAFLMISVVAAIVLILLATRTDGVFGGVFAWAVVAIGTKNPEPLTYQRFCYGIAGVVGILSVIALVVKFYLRYKALSQK